MPFMPPLAPWLRPPRPQQRAICLRCDAITMGEYDDLVQPISQRLPMRASILARDGGRRGKPAMNITETVLPGVLIVEPKLFGDARGFFQELYHQERYAGYGIAA